MKMRYVMQNVKELGAEDLELHPEEVKEKTDTYASLTELYGVNIFTHEFRLKQNKLQKAVYEENEKMEQQLFKNWKGEVGVREDELQTYLFKGYNGETYLPSYQVEKQSWGIMETAMVSISIAVVAMIYLLFSIDKKGRKR